MKFTSIALLLTLISCQKSHLSPEEALQDFVNSRVGTVVEREFILKRVTGQMLKNFQGMTAADFSKFADMKNIKTDSFKILSKSCQKHTCFLTYSISYVTKKEDKAQFSSEVEKVAEMIQVENKWLIANVSNIKTYHESLEPLNP